MRTGSIYVNLSGHRKATSRYCSACGTWHDTPRGLRPIHCPEEELLGLDPDAADVSFRRRLDLAARRNRRAGPAIVSAARLGSGRRGGPKIRVALTGPETA